MPTHDATHWTHESRDDYIFQLLHPRSAEGKFDFDYFFNVHLQKTNDVFKPASLIQTLITKADPTTDFLVVATFIFSDEKRFRKAMDSPEGQVLFADVASFSPATPTVVSGVVQATMTNIFVQLSYPASVADKFNLDYYINEHGEKSKAAFRGQGLLDYYVTKLDPATGHHIISTMFFETRETMLDSFDSTKLLGYLRQIILQPPLSQETPSPVNMGISRVLTGLAGLTTVALGQNSSTYTNPVLNRGGADPFAIQYNGQYLMTYTTSTNITMLRSSSLTDWNSAETKLVFDPPPGTNYSTNLWAPEIHQFNDRWYFIFTGDPNNDQPPPTTSMFCNFDCPAVNHRMFVLESSGPDPWTSNYTLKSQLDTYDQFAIDGTYFRHTTGLYHIYSCWYRGFDGWPANLCITKLTNPWTVESNFTERTIISVPSNPWEKTPYGRPDTLNSDRLSSNEGPQQLTGPTGREFVIYSAARSDNPNYCLAQLELVGEDPMNAQDWVKKNDGCVFYQNKRESAYGVGHASFVKSPDGSQDWVVYHGMRSYRNGWSERDIRVQRFTWGEDGSPRFPRPGYGPYEVPGGQA